MDDISGKINELFSNPESMEKIKALVGMLTAGQNAQNAAGGQPSPGGQNAAAQNNFSSVGSEPATENSGPAGNGSNGGGQNAAGQNTPGGFGDLGFDPAILLKIQQAMSLMKKGDPRIDLLLALKPNLNTSRQKKVDEAIHIMRLLNIMPLLREQGFLWGDG